MLEWRRRREPSFAMLLLSPVIAIVLTMLLGVLIFSAIGVNGVQAVRDIFLTPFLEPQRWPDLGVKGAPMIMIALGLAIGFRANVWNIGAEGQYIMGAIAGTGVALATHDMTGWWILPAMAIAGVLGGMAWGAMPALLRVKLQVSEILTSLMLTYVAVQVLYYLVRGPWKDPDGFNFPQTRMFTADQTLPIVIPETLVHLGIPLALLLEDLRFDWTQEAVLAMAWSVFGLSMGAVALLLRLIRRGQVSRAASLIYLMPPVVAIEAVILFGEPLTWPMIIGTVIVVTGVYMVNRKAKAGTVG